jgi:hypothetical protein
MAPFAVCHLAGPELKVDGKIRNPNIEIPAFAEAASRRQAKQIQNQILKPKPFVSNI